MSWFLNPDAPHSPTSPWTDYTRVAPPAGLGTLILDTRTALNMTPDEHLAGTAHHEAGHLVVFAHHHVPTGDVTFHPDGGPNNSRAGIHLPPSSGPWEGYAVGAAAGHRAEIGWMRRTGLLTPTREWVAERHSGTDRRVADTVVRQAFGVSLGFGDQTLRTDWAWMCDQADEILTPRWETVEALAVELMIRWGRGEHTVSASTVKRLLEGASCV